MHRAVITLFLALVAIADRQLAHTLDSTGLSDQEWEFLVKLLQKAEQIQHQETESNSRKDGSSTVILEAEFFDRYPRYREDKEKLEQKNFLMRLQKADFIAKIFESSIDVTKPKNPNISVSRLWDPTWVKYCKKTIARGRKNGKTLKCKLRRRIKYHLFEVIVIRRRRNYRPRWSQIPEKERRRMKMKLKNRHNHRYIAKTYGHNLPTSSRSLEGRIRVYVADRRYKRKRSSRHKE